MYLLHTHYYYNTRNQKKTTHNPKPRKWEFGFLYSPRPPPALVRARTQLCHSWTPAQCNSALDTTSSAFSPVAAIFTISF